MNGAASSSKAGEEEFNKLLQEYVDKFHDNFPARFIPRGEGGALVVLKKCLREGKPYNLDIPEGCDS